MLKRKILAAMAFVFTMIFAVTAMADYQRYADNTVPAYRDEALTNRTGNERVDRGDLVTVHQETSRAFEVTYPTPSGPKRRWVSKDIFNGSNDGNSKLQELINRWNGRTWTNGYSRSGNAEKYLNSSAIQCKEFAAYIFNILYDTGYIGSGSTSSNYYNWRLNNTPARVYQVAEVSQTNNRDQAREAFRNLFAQAQPGDFIQIKRGSGGAHSAIFVSRTDNGVQWLDANADGANSIRLQNYSYDDLVKTTSRGYQWNVAMSLYRAR